MAENTDVILLTGASSGIGRALAQRLSQSNYRVIATAHERSLHRLSENGLVESPRFLFRELDVNNAEQRAKLIDEIEQLWGGVDVLVNNAGISFRAVVEHMSDEEERRQLETNFLAPMALTRLVLPSMRRKRRGRIINVSSVGGMMAMPTMSSYSASKFALEGASEALWYEMRPWGISVTLVQPGFINSNAFRRVRWSAESDASRSHHDDYSVYYDNMSSFVEKLMTHSFATSDSVAKKIMKVIKMSHPPLRVSGTFDAWAFFALRRMLPRSLYHSVLYRSLPGIKEWGKTC
ncbi:MAG: SDR family oxidoreductase [Bdellovibrionales bacterium]|nr:SDR family oxidoreductase [Bdellovibrionales bacterium]